MPLTSSKLATAIYDSLMSELKGGGVPEVAEYRLALAKAIADAIVPFLILNLKDDKGSSHF